MTRVQGHHYGPGLARYYDDSYEVCGWTLINYDQMIMYFWVSILHEMFSVTNPS